MIKKLYPICALSLMLIAGCGGAGTSTENTSRSVTGNLGSTISESLSTLTSNGENLSSDCLADTVIATEASGVTTRADVSTDCSFIITLALNKSYAISFIMNDVFMASLVFDTSTNGSDDTLPIGAGDGVIDLGSISFTGDIARSEKNPYSQMDCDGNGIIDSIDDSNDRSEGSDEHEVDCGLDDSSDDSTIEEHCRHSSSREDSSNSTESENPQEDRGHEHHHN